MNAKTVASLAAWTIKTTLAFVAATGTVGGLVALGVHFIPAALLAASVGGYILFPGVDGMDD